VNLLQNDVFPPCEGNRRKIEGRPESGTDVGSSAATQHTHIYTNTHAQVEEHHGEDNYERPTETNKFSAVLNNVIKQGSMEEAALGASKTNDGEEGEAVGGKQAAAQGEDEHDRRLCGGCQKPKARKDFATHEWEKADAWSREADRRCQGCHKQAHSSRWEAMGRVAGPRERQPREYNRRDRRASQGSVKNDDSSKYCVREGASVAMHLQRGTAQHLYRWLPEAEEHSGSRGSW
jgi:hypothetical protein